MVFEASFVSAFQNELKDTHWLLEAFTLDDSDAWAHECHATIECFCVLVLIVTRHTPNERHTPSLPGSGALVGLGWGQPEPKED